jgi:hypothetical protein
MQRAYRKSAVDDEKRSLIFLEHQATWLLFPGNEAMRFIVIVHRSISRGATDYSQQAISSYRIDDGVVFVSRIWLCLAHGQRRMNRR